MTITTHRKLNLIIGKQYRAAYLRLLIWLIFGASFEALSIGGLLPFLLALSDPEQLMTNVNLIRILDGLNLPSTINVIVQFTGLAIISVMLAKGAVVFFANRQLAKLQFEERARISRELFQHYMQMPYAWSFSKNIAEAIHVVIGVATNFTTVYMSALLIIATELLVLFALLCVLIMVNTMITLVVAGVALALGWIFIYFTRPHSQRLGESQHRVVIAVNKCLIEGLSAMKEVRVYDAAKHFLAKIERLNKEYTSINTKATVFNQAPRLLIETIFIVSIVGFVISITYSGLDLKGVVPTLGVFGMALLRIMPSYNRIIVNLTSMRMNESALDVLHAEMAAINSKSIVYTSARQMGDEISFNKQIAIENLHYSYPGASAPALSGVTLNFRKGQTIGLVGKSGSGKTTLIDIVLGLLTPQEGSVKVDEREVLNFSLLQGLVGYIPQNIYLIDDTVRRNIAFGINDEEIDEAAILRAVHAAQLDEYINALPGGLDTVVGDRGVKLSGGQRQRIGIARALYRDPQILVLDEATSSLDVETEVAVTDAIRKLGVHKTLIVVAHRLSTVRDCDVLYLLECGKVVAQGSYDQLILQNKWFSKASMLSSVSN